MVWFLKRRRPKARIERSGGLSAPAPALTAIDPGAARRALRAAFTPTQPVRAGHSFTGRNAQVARVLGAIEIERAHVVLYADRGRGKTSLTNVLAHTLRARNHMVARFVCAVESDFETVCRGLVRDLPRSFLAVPLRDDDELEGCEGALPSGKLQPRDIVALAGRLTGRSLVLIVDEFDRVQDDATRTRLADTIKQVSDRGAPIAFLIVGVSDSLEELFGRHPSIQRSIVPLPLPLLTDPEIESILSAGAQSAGLAFRPAAIARIRDLARGVPYVAHLLALHAGNAALDRGSMAVGVDDVRAAVTLAVEQADPRVAALYDLLTDAGQDPQATDTLREIAAGDQDEFGRFRMRRAEGGVLVAGQFMPSDAWRQMLDAGVVRRIPGPDVAVHAFTEATFRNYVLYRALHDAAERILAE